MSNVTIETPAADAQPRQLETLGLNHEAEEQYSNRSDGLQISDYFAHGNTDGFTTWLDHDCEPCK